MSLTNPNTVVTEERLNDFYKGILPYLGGMPEMVANKFSKGDLYSTDEKMIGQWIDGKPLYQKTIEVNVTTSTNQGANIYTGEISISTFFDFSTIDNMFFDIEHSFYVLGNARGFVYGWVAKEALTVLLGTLYARSNAPSKLTFQYTKTTDSPISIGDANDYSTEEKIVGTWVDGKPIYQKTFSGSYSMNSTPVVINDIQIANVHTLISEEFIADGGTSGSRYTFTSSLAGFTNENKLRCAIIGSDTRTITMITLRYTKTT